jgi:hypothetical protein
MPAVTYPISSTEAATLVTTTILYSKYSASCIKTLTVALDPNVDRTLINPTEAYSGSSS